MNRKAVAHTERTLEVIGYVRRFRRAEAPGEAAQRRAVTGWATRAKAKVVQWLVEKSGPAGLAERPAMLQALSALSDSGLRVLCVASPDILDDAPWARRVIEHVAKHVGGRVVYAASDAVDADPSPDLDVALDLHEHLLARLRATTAAPQTRRDGHKGDYCPWGYRLSKDGKRLEPYEPEQATLFIARDLRRRGLKLREVAEELQRLGIVGRTGRPLGMTSIHNLLNTGHGTRNWMPPPPGPRRRPPPLARALAAVASPRRG
jgi:hypothetical protein